MLVMIARHLVISGRVQGVGYRDAMREEAARLGVGGWVRNRSDGCVQAFLQGPEPAVEALTRWAARGPRLAAVASVIAETRPLEDPAPPAFRRLPSA